MPRTGTPLWATALAACIVAGAAVLVSFEQLLVLTNALTLAIFVLVDLALWRVQRTGQRPTAGFAAPPWVPPVAAVLAAGLMLSELLDW